jgi:hypothetical protein
VPSREGRRALSNFVPPTTADDAAAKFADTAADIADENDDDDDDDDADAEAIPIPVHITTNPDATDMPSLEEVNE